MRTLGASSTYRSLVTDEMTGCALLAASCLLRTPLRKATLRSMTYAVREPRNGHALRSGKPSVIYVDPNPTHEHANDDFD